MWEFLWFAGAERRKTTQQTHTIQRMRALSRRTTTSLVCTTTAYLGQSIEAREQFVEHFYQVLRRVRGRDGRKANDVRVQNAE